VYLDGTKKVVVAIVTLCLGELVMQLVCPTDLDETETTSLLVRDDALRRAYRTVGDGRGELAAASVARQEALGRVRSLMQEQRRRREPARPHRPGPRR
jgi:hypothetical protein